MSFVYINESLSSHKDSFAIIDHSLVLLHDTVQVSGKENKEKKVKKTKNGSGSQKKAPIVQEDSVVGTSHTHRLRCSPLVYLQLVAHALLRRRSSFSTTLLVEMSRRLTTSFACVLLRIFLLYADGITCEEIFGLSPRDMNRNMIPTSNVVISRLSIELRNMNALVSETELTRRAVIWVQAILDGHFAAIALNAYADTLTRQTLLRAMKIVGAAESSEAFLETAIGVCHHVMRHAKYGGVFKANKFDMYEVETLVI